MDIKKLWKGIKFPRCEFCKKECRGHLDYENLCANLNYLEEYAEKNFEKNNQSLLELNKICKRENKNFFSFGCGLGLECFAVEDIFGTKVNYFGIDNCEWAIKKTKLYKEFQPKLPKTVKYDDGIFLLSTVKNASICFFNSLYTISSNSNLKHDLIEALQNKDYFNIICNFTINSNFHLPFEEKKFLRQLTNSMRIKFRFKYFEILEGKGIIIIGEKIDDFKCF